MSYKKQKNGCDIMANKPDTESPNAKQVGKAINHGGIAAFLVFTLFAWFHLDNAPPNHLVRYTHRK